MALAQLEQFLDQIKTFDPHAELLAIVQKNAARITELQQEQLSYGIDITGAARIDEYRPLTIHLKNTLGVGLGAVTDRVTFFMTGQLYGDLKPVFSGDNVEVKSDLPTFNKMIDRIGPNSYGLSPGQRFEFAETITLPEFAIVLEQKTGLKL